MLVKWNEKNDRSCACLLSNPLRSRCKDYEGTYYTSPIFQNRVKKYKLGQFMSRRGNC